MSSCDYSTLARLARIEAREIERAESSSDYLPIQDARDYALAVEAMRREDLHDFKDNAFHHMCRTRGLTEGKRTGVQLEHDALVDALAMHLIL